MLLSSLALLIALAVGTTAAFLITNDEPIVNTFNPSKVTSAVNEAFNGAVKSNVTVANTGDTEAYIRATYVVTWKDEYGQVYGKTPQPNEDYVISIGSGWIPGSDGYYYYVSPVAPGDSTTALIVSCEPVAGRTPEGFGLNVEILGSAIQSTPANVVHDKWKVVSVDAATRQLIG